MLSVPYFLSMNRVMVQLKSSHYGIWILLIFVLDPVFPAILGGEGEPVPKRYKGRRTIQVAIEILPKQQLNI